MWSFDFAIIGSDNKRAFLVIHMGAHIQYYHWIQLGFPGFLCEELKNGEINFYFIETNFREEKFSYGIKFHKFFEIFSEFLEDKSLLF